MFKRITVLLSLLFLWQISFADTDSSHLRISLLTCGPGQEEIYEVFGHTGLRIIDSANGTDQVYNYGTFEYGPNFEMQFMRGKLLYCVSVSSFREFMSEYLDAHRSVEEQILLLNGKQKESIDDFLQWNMLPQNRYYKYDFFFDNCATRIRDIFPRQEVFGDAFHFGSVLPVGSKLTFRDIINRYFNEDKWTRMGVNLLLGSKIDRVMSNTDIMFLPDYLRDGIAGATVNGHDISTKPVTILQGSANPSTGTNQPFLLTIIVAVLTILGLTVHRLRVLGRIMSSLLLFVTGLLGCVILFMWFGTDHQGCSDNFNILWCLPTNLMLAFYKPKGSNRYALIAIILLLLSVVLHIMRVQQLLLPEFGPLLLSLLFVYGTIYMKTKPAPVTLNATN